MIHPCIQNLRVYSRKSIYCSVYQFGCSCTSICVRIQSCCDPGATTTAPEYLSEHDNGEAVGGDPSEAGGEQRSLVLKPPMSLFSPSTPTPIGTQA